MISPHLQNCQINYEQLEISGHHRLAALAQSNIETVALSVQDYIDYQMITLMVNENMTQRGDENFGAVLDSVAAVIVGVVGESNLGVNLHPNHIESRLFFASNTRDKFEEGE